MNVWYYGLADCHGIESFVPVIDDTMADMFLADGFSEKFKTEQFALCMRAHANQQRHSVVYRVLIPIESVKDVEDFLAKGKYIDALDHIKSVALETQLSTYSTTKAAAEKNWRMIPNPDLDPYHTSSDDDEDMDEGKDPVKFKKIKK